MRTTTEPGYRATSPCPDIITIPASTRPLHREDPADVNPISATPDPRTDSGHEIQSLRKMIEELHERLDERRSHEPAETEPPTTRCIDFTTMPTPGPRERTLPEPTPIATPGTTNEQTLDSLLKIVNVLAQESMHDRQERQARREEERRERAAQYQLSEINAKSTDIFQSQIINIKARKQEDSVGKAVVEKIQKRWGISSSPLYALMWTHQCSRQNVLWIGLKEARKDLQTSLGPHLMDSILQEDNEPHEKHAPLLYDALSRMAVSKGSKKKAGVFKWYKKILEEKKSSDVREFFSGDSSIESVENTSRQLQEAFDWLATFCKERGETSDALKPKFHNLIFLEACLYKKLIGRDTARSFYGSHLKAPLSKMVHKIRGMEAVTEDGNQQTPTKETTLPTAAFHTPDPTPFSPSVCTHYKRGYCRKGGDCTFVHDERLRMNKRTSRSRSRDRDRSPHDPKRSRHDNLHRAHDHRQKHRTDTRSNRDLETPRGRPRPEHATDSRRQERAPRVVKPLNGR